VCSGHHSSVNVVLMIECAQCSNELGHALVAAELSETLLGFEDAECDPASDHGRVAPPANTVLDAADRAIQVLDGVGRGQRAFQRFGQTEVLQSEGFRRALP
jgi:hypothetical protein